MNIIETMTNTAIKHKNAPDAVLFDQLCKDVEAYNDKFKTKFNVSNEVEAFIRLKGKAA